MPLGSKFQRSESNTSNNAGAKPGGARPAAGGRKPFYAGMKSAKQRPPFPCVGVYRFELLRCEEGYNEGNNCQSFKVFLKIIDMVECEVDSRGQPKHKIGEEVMVSFRTTGNGSQAGRDRLKAFVVGIAGYANDDEYDAFDPDGLYIEALTDVANDYHAEFKNSAGRLVDCQVVRGGARKDKDGNLTGEYFTDYKWTVVEDDDGQNVKRPALAA
jgi:hypothetical protein